MKKLSLLVFLVLIAALAYGVMSTGAWFTDSAQLDGSIKTSTLDLKVTGSLLPVTDLEPGAAYESLGIFCAQNVGGYDMKWRGFIEINSDEKGLESYVRVRAVLNPEGYVGNFGPANSEVFTDVPLSALTDYNRYIVLNDAGWAFAPGHVACYDIQARVIGAAPNDVQGAVLNSTLYLDATQYINTGWGE